MLIVMDAHAPESAVAAVCQTITEMGYRAAPLPGPSRTAIGVVGNDRPLDPGRFAGLPGVREVLRVSVPYKRVSREWQPHDTQVTLAPGVVIGGGRPVVIAGPCAVETAERLETAAQVLVDRGVRVMRAGAFKPRTSPYDFQGLGIAGLDLLADVARRHGLVIVTEAMDAAGADAIAERGFVVQIGARNMQNFALLHHVGKLNRPIVLKRGPSATIQEWLLAAEYVLDAGNSNVMLCERGLRGFDPATRNIMDIAAIALLRQLTHLPVLADPSHGTGRRDLVTPMACAALAAGAQGLLVEMHPNPAEAWSDGAQSLTPAQLTTLLARVDALTQAMAG